MWNNEMEGGAAITAMVSTIVAPSGKVSTVLTGGKFRK